MINMHRNTRKATIVELALLGMLRDGELTLEVNPVTGRYVAHSKRS